MSGGALGFRAQQRYLYQGSYTERTGTFFGGEGVVSLGAFRIEASGLTGTLPSTGDPAFPKLNVRTTTVAFAVEPAGGLEIGVLGEAWHLESDAASTGWRLFGVKVGVSPSMGLGWLHGNLELAYFPVAEWVTGGRSNVALRGETNLTLGAPGGGPWLRLGYRFERFDLKGLGDSRLEQYQGPTAAVGIRLGR